MLRGSNYAAAVGSTCRLNTRKARKPPRCQNGYLIRSQVRNKRIGPPKHSAACSGPPTNSRRLSAEHFNCAISTVNDDGSCPCLGRARRNGESTARTGTDQDCSNRTETKG